MARYGGEIYDCHFLFNHTAIGNGASQLISENDNVVLSEESVRNTRSRRTRSHVNDVQDIRDIRSSSENKTHKSTQGQRDKYSNSKKTNQVTSVKKQEKKNTKITAARTHVRERPANLSDLNSQTVEQRKNKGERSQYGDEIYNDNFLCTAAGNRASQLISENDNVVLSKESVRNTRSRRTRSHVNDVQDIRDIRSSSETKNPKSAQGQRDKYSKSKNANQVTSDKKQGRKSPKITAARTYVKKRPVHTKNDLSSQNVKPSKKKGKRSQLRRSYELLEEEEEEQINGIRKSCSKELDINETFWQKLKRRLRLQQPQSQQEDRRPLCYKRKDSRQSNGSFCESRCLKKHNSESGLEMAYKEKHTLYSEEEQMSQTTNVREIKIHRSFMDIIKPMKFSTRKYQKMKLELPCENTMEIIKEEHHYENVGIWNEIKTKKYDESHHALLTCSPIHSTNVYNSKPEQVMLNDRFHKQTETKIKKAGDTSRHREKMPSRIEDTCYVNIQGNMGGVTKEVYSQNTRKKAKKFAKEREVKMEDIYQNIWQNETPVFDDDCSDDEDVTISTTKAFVHLEDVSNRSSLDNMKHCTRDLRKQNELKIKETDLIEWDEIHVSNQEKEESKQKKKVLCNIDIMKQEEKKVEHRVLLLPRRTPRTLKQKVLDFFGVKRKNSKQQDRKREM